MRQFFVDENLNENELVRFNNEQRHHICDVLRMKNNDCVRIVDNKNQIYLCELLFENGDVFAKIVSKIDAVENGDTVLIAALIKKENWELIIQKACELGASKIVPLITNRTIIHLNDSEIDKKVERWNKIALQACQQSNRNMITEVMKPVKIKNLEQFKGDINLVAYENEKGETLKDYVNEGSITIVIGPEGGLERKEVDILNEMGFKAVSLGNNILRAETACMYALSVISALR